jgi:hypothetical protein
VRLRTALIIAVVAAVALAAAATLIRLRRDPPPAGPYALTSEHLGALASPRTIVRRIPSVAQRVAVGFGVETPGPSQLHRLGGGSVSAWRTRRGVCWFGGYTPRRGFGVAECVAPTSAPIEWIATTPGLGDTISVVEGLATDGVISVRVRLCDERGTVVTRPHDNFYVARLPAGPRPWNVCEVSARLAGGARYNETIAIPHHR